MRTYKFRAWDKTNNKMLIDSNLWIHIYPQKNISEDSVANLPDYHTSEIPCEISYDARTDLDVMQYTGLHDKNGKEIYEGDIIRWDEDDGCNYELFFHDEEYRYSLRPHWVGNRCGGYVPEFKLGKIFEVIGNIYEHAELLTK